MNGGMLSEIIYWIKKIKQNDKGKALFISVKMCESNDLMPFLLIIVTTTSLIWLMDRLTLWALTNFCFVKFENVFVSLIYVRIRF